MNYGTLRCDGHSVTVHGVPRDRMEQSHTFTRERQTRRFCYNVMTWRKERAPKIKKKNASPLNLIFNSPGAAWNWTWHENMTDKKSLGTIHVACVALKVSYDQSLTHENRRKQFCFTGSASTLCCTSHKNHNNLPRTPFPVCLFWLSSDCLVLKQISLAQKGYLWASNTGMI